MGGLWMDKKSKIEACPYTSDKQTGGGSAGETDLKLSTEDQLHLAAEEKQTGSTTQAVLALFFAR